MFSLEYFNQAALITALDVQRIDFFRAERIRQMVLAAIERDCPKIVLSVRGVKEIDSGAIEVLKYLKNLAQNSGIVLLLSNVCQECRTDILRTDEQEELNLLGVEELSGHVAYPGT